MQEWAQVGSAAGTLAMLLVWTAYLRLALNQYREQKRPWFVLHEAGAGNLSSRCVLVNMSSQIAHISSVVTVVHTRDRSLARRVGTNDGDNVDSSYSNDAASHRERPLASGESVSLGSFEQLFDGLVPAEAEGERPSVRYGHVEYVELRVVAVSPADEKHPLGAYRCFLFEEGTPGKVVVRPRDMYTRQMRTRHDRRQIRDWEEQVWRHYGSDDWWEVEERRRDA